MKNTTNMEENGARWVMLNGISPAGRFQSWGATSIYRVPHDDKNGRPGLICMIRLEDGWHYAHADDASCYCAPEAINQATGAIAWADFEHRCSQLRRQMAERALEQAKDEESHFHTLFLQSIQPETTSPVS